MSVCSRCRIKRCADATNGFQFLLYSNLTLTCQQIRSGFSCWIIIKTHVSLHPLISFWICPVFSSTVWPVMSSVKCYSFLTLSLLYTWFFGNPFFPPLHVEVLCSVALQAFKSFFSPHFVPKLSFRSKIKIDKLRSLKAQVTVFLVILYLKNSFISPLFKIKPRFSKDCLLFTALVLKTFCFL